MQTNRLFQIIYILLNKKTTTARELAEEFNVSTRTIYRDVDVLSLAGIPLYTEKGKGGGISLLPDFVLNKSLLSEGEQTEILSALQGLQAVQATEAGEVLQKLSSVFNKNVTPWLDVDFSDWGGYGVEVFQGLKTAILEQKVAEFDYYSTYGEKTTRKIEPIQLWFKSKTWYVKGFCLLRQDVRLFRLSRIRNLHVSSKVFEQRNLLETEPDTPCAQRPNSDVTLKLKIAPEMTYRIFDEFEKGEPQPDGSHIVTVTWPEDEWVYGFIMSFGDFCEVLEPAHVREIVREKLTKMAKMYG